MSIKGVKEKKTTMRMCVVCREMRPKKEIFRVVKSPEGEISWDLSGKASGRGAYICNSIECLNKAIKTRAFNRAFSCDVPQEVYNRIKEEFLAKK